MKSLVLVGMIVVCGVAACTSKPAPETSTLWRGAATPSEAYERLLKATADADEQAYRSVVLIESPGGFADTAIDAMFASFRLHHAVQEKGVTSERVRSAGFDRNERLIVPEPPDAKMIQQAADAIRSLQWKIDGDEAKPATGGMLIDNSFGEASMRRINGDWLVRMTDPVKPTDDEAHRKQVEAMSRDASELAKITDAAREEVLAGRLKTVLAVNDFITARRKQLNLGKPVAGQ